MTSFWMVWNEGNQDPRYKHPTERQARDEAERLARANPGKRFFLLRAVDVCKWKDISWEVDDSVPF